MTDKSIHDALARNDFFRRLPDPYLDFLAEHARERHCKADEMIFCQGDRAENFYLLMEGAVDIEVPAVYGPSIVIQNLGAGMVLGWSWLIAPYRWDFQAQAQRDSALIEFDGNAILEHCEQDHSFGYALYKQFTELMSQRLSAARRRMMEQWNPSGFA